MIVRPYIEDDIESICDIYNYYVNNTVITFEEVSVSLEDMKRRISSTAENYPWLVCEAQGEIVGYAYACRWKERAAYKQTAEATVYIREGFSGRGFGKALYTALLNELRNRSCHVVLGCIALPNDASVRLHESLGFEKVAHFNEVGFKFNQWLDVGYWQVQLDCMESSKHVCNMNPS